MDSTFAEVLNKALEMGEVGVIKASEMIQGVAPELWGIMVRQVYADAIGDFILMVLITGIIGMIVKISFKKMALNKGDYNKNGWDVDDPYCWYAGIGFPCFVFFLIMSSIALSFLVKAIANPKFYAIKNISGLF